MTLTTPAGYSSSDLVYQDGFDNGTILDSDWHKYITSKAADGWAWNSYGSAGGSGPGSVNNWDYDLPTHVTQHDGVLDILTTKDPVTGMNQGTLETYPTTSGAVSSYGNMEFTGGLLQISMKAPAGDGAWPSLWLMPGAGSSQGDSFEIDIQEGGYTGKGNPNQAFTWHLHGPGGSVGGTVDSGIDLTAGYHTYAIDWQPGKSITWYLDGKQMGQVTSAQMTIPSQPMQLIMNNQVASSATSGWHTVLDSSTPQTEHMLIDAVQLYQHAGSGNTVKGGNVTAGSTPTNPTTPVNTAPTVTGVSAQPGSGVEHVGDKIALTVAFSEAVTVSGKPALTLNDGSVATYVGGSGTDKLVFSSMVAATDKSVSALGVVSLDLPNGATIKDSGGLAANVSGAVKSLSGLSVDTTPTTPTQPVNTAPSVTGASAQPGTGVEHVGDKIALTVAFSEAVTVNGKPALTLNDGSVATYVSGSGTDKLVFSSIVAATDKSVSALGVTGVNLPNGATIKDSTGLAANLSGASKTFAGLQIDTTPAAPTQPTNPTTPPATSAPTRPVVTIADDTLRVSPGGKIDLGIDVSTTDMNDAVSVNIKGLTRYETITDGLGHTFKGKDITLTAAQVESGLELHSFNKGQGESTNTLSVTATGKDPVTGTSLTSAAQTITVTDPPVSGGSTPSNGGSAPVTSAPVSSGNGGGHDHSFALLTQALAGGLHGADLGQIASAVASNASSWLNESILTRPDR